MDTDNKKKIYNYAVQLRNAGFEVIPVDPITKSPGVREWTTRTYSVEEIKDKIFNYGLGIGIRNHEIIDFDNKGNPDAQTLYNNWKDIIDQTYPGLVDKLLLEKTQHGGFHVSWRCSIIGENQKLARREPTSEELVKNPHATAPCLIETRGKNGQFLVSPTPGYSIIYGDWMNLYEITPEQREFLLDAAQSFNKIPKTIYAPKTYNPEVNGIRPGDVYNIRDGIIEALQILKDNGWKEVYSRENIVRLCRPGKNKGVSGTYGHIAPGVFYCFTSSGSPFEPDHAYSPFQVLALLRHGGNFSQAAKELAIRYGIKTLTGKAPIDEKEFSMVTEANELIVKKSSFSSVDSFKPVLLSELKEEDCKVEWIWDGFIAKGHITLLSALWKAGKTTFLAELFRCMSENSSLAGQKIYPCRTLYFSEERTSQWFIRRKEKNISIPIFLLCSPIKRKLDYRDWVALIQKAADFCVEEKINLVVIDTLTTFSSVNDENDSMQVNAALLPLNYFRENNIAVLLVHHFRKSGGAEGTASRGSGALSSYVDIIMEFSRLEPDDPQGTQRKLISLSRFDGTPSEIILDYVDGEYSSLIVTSSREAKKQNKANKVLGLISKLIENNEIPEQFGSVDLYNNWDDSIIKRPVERTIRNYLDTLVAMEKLTFSKVEREDGKFKAKKYSLLHGNKQEIPNTISTVNNTEDKEYINIDTKESQESFSLI